MQYSGSYEFSKFRQTLAISMMEALAEIAPVEERVVLLENAIKKAPLQLHLYENLFVVTAR